MATKKIYFEPSGRLHPAHRELVRRPPKGYEFVLQNTRWDKAMNIGVGSDFIYRKLYFGLRRTFPLNLMPFHLLKLWLEQFSKRPPTGTDLTYSYNHVIFRKEPWVVQVEYPVFLVGLHAGLLHRWRPVVERRLASRWCKKILCWSEVAKKSLLVNLDHRLIQDKVQIIPLSVSPKAFTKTYDAERIKLFFVGSGSEPRRFREKGGKEVLEAFLLLTKKYDHLELVIRCDVPPNVKRTCEGLPNVKLMEKLVPWEKLEQEFKTADIFLLPTLFPGQDMAILDAMSYELPVITTSYGANSEMVKDGITGFVVPSSGRIPEYDEDLNPAELSALASRYYRAIKTTDYRVVEGIVDKASMLIEDLHLRERMGRAGRREVEEGQFSIGNTNTKLGRVLDEATADTP